MDSTLPNVPALPAQAVPTPLPYPPPRPQLPIEICEIIIDYVASTARTQRRKEHRQTLRCCLQVCHAWIPRSQFHLMAKVVFRSRDSVAYFSRLLQRSPDLRQRIKEAVIKVQDAADQSWVSCVPFLLPLQLNSLRLDRDVDLSLLHPTASRRFDLLKVKEIDLALVRYTRYSQIARFAVTGAVKATWFLQEDVLSNGGVIRGKRTALKNVVVSAHTPRELIALLRNFSIFSSNPLVIDFYIDLLPTAAAPSHLDPRSSLRKPPVFLRQYNMYSLIPENRRTWALKHLPGDHQAIWNCLLRVWQMHCCRNREEAALKKLSICDMTTRFTLSREFLGESSDVGPSTLILQVWEMLDGIPCYAGAVLGFLSQLGFQEVNLKLRSTRPWGAFKPDLVLFLDDALSLPNFSTLTRVTLQVSLKHPPSACKRNFAPLMLPRTYARGLMELVDDCKRSNCVIHRPPPSVSPLPAPSGPPTILDLW
ncbi:hypothetical protein EIP91_006918 [Steccherinum ochraceum]|uniref:F-box domain-containing protein n=1 Tax=Steccherinum ochraceum TaxID=92696 RepID=A0A4V2MVH3_9APHY|nr:hypothetical protein EIP91_006918 [Steccherinum ochraceum]